MLSATGRDRSWVWKGASTVQSARPRDMGALVLVVGLLLVLVVISVAFGSPAVR
jgi:hypothetical protein